MNDNIIVYSDYSSMVEMQYILQQSTIVAVQMMLTTDVDIASGPDNIDDSCRHC